VNGPATRVVEIRKKERGGGKSDEGKKEEGGKGKGAQFVNTFLPAPIGKEGKERRKGKKKPDAKIIFHAPHARSGREGRGNRGGERKKEGSPSTNLSQLQTPIQSVLGEKRENLSYGEGEEQGGGKETTRHSRCMFFTFPGKEKGFEGEKKKGGRGLKRKEKVEERNKSSSSLPLQRGGGRKRAQEGGKREKKRSTTRYSPTAGPPPQKGKEGKRGHRSEERKGEEVTPPGCHQG